MSNAARHRFAVRCWLASIPLAVLLATGPNRAAAQVDVVWNVMGPADWNTAANWTPARVPTGTDNATFNNGGTANFSTNVTDTFTDIRFGDGSANGGTVNQSAGTINASGGWLRMNMSGTANSTYTLSGFASATFARINVNETAGAGTSTLNMQGGSDVLTIPQSNAGNGQGALFINGGTGSGTGIVHITGGTLNVGADTAGNQSIIVGNGGTNTAQLNIDGNAFVSVNVSGAGNFYVGDTSPGVVNQSTGTVNLFTGAGANSWLRIGSGANGTYTLSGGRLTTTNATNDLVLGNTNATGTFNLNGGTATIGGAIYGFGPSIFNFNGGTLRPGGNAVNQTSFMSGLTAANVHAAAIIDTNGFDITIAQNLIHDPALDGSNDGGLVKNGGGTLTLTGNNTFNGGVTINAGTLDAANIGALNATAPNKVTFGPASAGILQLDVSGGLIAAGGLDSNANLGTPVVQPAPGLQTFTGLRINNTGTDAFAGNVTAQPIDNGFQVDKVGPGTQIFSGNNSFGLLTIGAGNVQLASAGALPNLVDLGFDPGSTGTLTLGGYSVTVSGVFNDPNVGTPVIQNASPTPTTFTLNDLGFDNEFDGAIRDGSGGAALALTKTGNGTLILGGNNTFTGGVTINGGFVQLGNPGALNSANPNVVTFGANFSEYLALDGNSVTVAGLVASTSDPVVLNGGIVTATLSIQVANASSYAGAFQDGPGPGKLSITKTGPGTLTLSGTSTATGPINVNGGTLVESGGGLVADVHDQASFVYNSGTFAGRLFVAGSATFNASFAAGNGLENDVNLTVPSGLTITLNGLGLDNEGTLTLSGGTLNLSSSATAANVNRGTFNLSASFPFSLGGATLTNNGTLNLNAGLIGGPGTLVNGAGGTIAGTGTISAAFANSVGQIAVGPGNVNITGAFSNAGGIQLSAINANLTGGAISNTGTIQGFGNLGNAVTNNGIIEAIGGTLFITGVLTNPPAGTLTTDSGAKLLITQGLPSNSGIVNLTGGTFDNNNQPLANTATGQISGWGIFRTGGTGLDNHGSITFSGGQTTVNGPVTNEGGKTITVAQNNAIFTGLVTNNASATFNTVNATATFAGGFVNNGNSNFIKAGGGVVEIDAAPTLNNGSMLSVTTGTMRFNIVSGAPAIGTGVSAMVSAGATLELASSVSALANGPNRVNITNNSFAPGILISGTNQQVGNIDGSGTTQVNAGSDLTANHIIQGALVIGGTSKNPGLVAIDASDASGNSLAGIAVPGAMIPNIPLGVGANLTDPPGLATNNDPLTASSPPLVSSLSASPVAVPEPSSLILFLVGCLAVGDASVRRRRCGRHTVKGFSCSARRPA